MKSNWNNYQMEKKLTYVNVVLKYMFQRISTEAKDKLSSYWL